MNERETAEFAGLCELAVNQEVRAMEMTWAERMEEKYTQKGLEEGLEKGIEALRRVVLRLLNRRFGSVPETVRRRVEGIEAMEPLESLAERALEVKSIEDLGLS